MKNWLLGAAGLLLVILCVSLGLYLHLNGQQRTLLETGKTLAHEKTDINEVLSVDQYNGKVPYIVVQGITKKGEPLVAWFKGNQVDAVEDMNRLVSKKSVIQAIVNKNPRAEIIHVIPGEDGQQKFWEALFVDSKNKFNYYYIDMYTGQFIKSYQLQQATS
ncbi:DUF5590 domain-containing protein [Aneurinibacillus terranovensis]|uniref:cell wall elongation regulator TseB-like domain-containing protein n=1 Tax=Aneurinibacillus terranovensis TaxID=278991 RepID=UPI000408AA59|nr:DUF5590 domain-containing protein [Aneurinibacillus terranovensis]